MRKNGTMKQREEWARKGGKIGGRRRAKALTPERRSEIARMGAIARHGRGLDVKRDG